MRLDGQTLDEITANFRWDIPARFNMAAWISDRHAVTDPHRIALIEDFDRHATRTYTARQLSRLANQCAHMLKARGVGPGVVVAINLPQSAECAVVHIAVQKAGGIALPLFNLFGSEAICYRLADSGAAILITTAEKLESIDVDLASVRTLQHTFVVDVYGVSTGAFVLDHSDFATELARASDAPITADTGPDDPALLMYTSGTTGQPKGVLHAGRVLLGHLPGVSLFNDRMPQPGDRYWTPADWAWAGGLLDVLLPALYFGVPVVAARRKKFDPEWAFEFLAKHQIRNCFLPATALRLMRGVPNPRARFATELRTLCSGGESLGPDLMQWGEDALGVTIAEFFGQTEVNLVVANSPKLFSPRPGSMGRAVPGHTVAIVDDAGNVVPDGTPGMVAVCRPDPVMFLEYWKKPEATADKFRGRWCLLGDIAIRDADGYFWYRGRDDDIINSAGYRIGPGEVEDCLGRHPAVALAGVIGSPDPVRGEVVAAFVVLKAGFAESDALAAEIAAFVRARLAAHEYPRKIRFIAEMPMTVTGKVRRKDLRALDREV